MTIKGSTSELSFSVVLKGLRLLCSSPNKDYFDSFCSVTPDERSFEIRVKPSASMFEFDGQWRDPQKELPAVRFLQEGCCGGIWTVALEALSSTGLEGMFRVRPLCET